MFSKMFKLTKEVRTFQAGEYTGFGFQVGAQYYDKKAGEKKWTNFKAAVFAKSPAQIEFYKSTLTIGSHVELIAEDMFIDTWTKDDGSQIHSIELVNARIGGIATANAPQQQQGYGQQAPQQRGGVPNDSDLPF